MDEIKPFMEALLGLKDPWTLTRIEADLEAGQVDLYVDFLPGSRWPCPECGQGSCPVHDTVERTWRHMNLFQYKTYVHARVPRVKCPDHGVRQVKVPWSREGSGFTLLFESLAMSLVKFMPVREAALILDEWDTRIWRIVRHYVERSVEGQDLSGLTRVGIDETSWKRRHRYLTVFMDLDSKRVVFVAPTRQKDTLKGFLDFLRTHNGNPSSVRHFSCDLSGAYAQGIREHFPHATVTADRFHLVKLVNDAVDAVRRMEQKSVKGLKRTRFLWLKNRGDLSVRERTHLEVLLDHPAYARMGRAHALKESFRDLFSMRPKEAEVNLKQWLHWASHSRLSPMVKLARTFREQKSAILRWFSTRLSNGLLEGLNSLFQAARAKARGYRSLRYGILAFYLVGGRFEFQLPKFYAVTHTK